MSAGHETGPVPVVVAVVAPTEATMRQQCPVNAAREMSTL